MARTEARIQRGQERRAARDAADTAATTAGSGQSTDAPPAEPTQADPPADLSAEPDPPAPEPGSVPSSALDIGSTPDAPDVPQTNLRVEEAKREVRVDPPPGRAALEADERAPVKLVPQADRASSRAARKRARLQKDLDEAKQAIDSSEAPSLSIEIRLTGKLTSQVKRALRSAFQTLCFRARIQLTSHSHTWSQQAAPRSRCRSWPHLRCTQRKSPRVRASSLQQSSKSSTKLLTCVSKSKGL